MVVDDDADVCEVVTDCLSHSGYNVLSSADGESAIESMKSQIVELAIVDLGLPDMDGLEVIRSLKSFSDVSIIILSGRTDTAEKIVGLEVGADDYLAKPFEPRELLARVRSVLRRRVSTPAPEIVVAKHIKVYSFDGWRLDLIRREFISEDGDVIELTSNDFDFLKVFVEHSNQVLTRDQIIEHAYNSDYPAFDRSVDIRIARLRKKIEKNPNTRHWIKTVRNAGYKFAADVTCN